MFQNPNACSTRLCGAPVRALYKASKLSTKRDRRASTVFLFPDPSTFYFLLSTFYLLLLNFLLPIVITLKVEILFTLGRVNIRLPRSTPGFYYLDLLFPSILPSKPPG
jgi:hypothetical protein